MASDDYGWRCAVAALDAVATGMVTPPGEFLNDELDARGWTEADLVARMDGDHEQNTLAVAFVMTLAPSPRMRLGEDLSARIGRALGLGDDGFFHRLDEAWRTKLREIVEAVPKEVSDGDALMRLARAVEECDEAEFELAINGKVECGASGPREKAWREIQHYAAQYALDGDEVQIYQVTRKVVQGPPTAASEPGPSAPPAGYEDRAFTDAEWALAYNRMARQRDERHQLCETHRADEEWRGLENCLACAVEELEQRVTQLSDELDAAASEPAPEPVGESAADLVAHLRRQRAWSEQTFGPGRRTAAIIDHIRKELGEIEACPQDVREWIDVVMLALDGAWRTSAEPEHVVAELALKLRENQAREWPDWRTAPEGKAIEHVRAEPTPPIIEEGGKRLTQDEAPPSPEQAEQIERLKRQLGEWEAKAKAVREAEIQQRIDAAVAAERARLVSLMAVVTRLATGPTGWLWSPRQVREEFRARAAQAGTEPQETAEDAYDRDGENSGEWRFEPCARCGLSDIAWPAGEPGPVTCATCDKVDAAVAAEREECAKLADKFPSGTYLGVIARAIRSRKDIDAPAPRRPGRGRTWG